jgi:hypothetical protein
MVRNVVPQRAGDVDEVDGNDWPTAADVGVLDRGAVNLDLGCRSRHRSTLGCTQPGSEPVRCCRYCVRAEVVYQWCVVFPVLAVVGAVLAGVLELDVDEDDALVVGAVDAGADGGLRFPD